MTDKKRRPALAKLPDFWVGTQGPSCITWESEKFPFHVVVYEYAAHMKVDVFFGSSETPVWRHTVDFPPPKDRDTALLSIEIETATYLKKAVSELRSWIMNPF